MFNYGRNTILVTFYTEPNLKKDLRAIFKFKRRFNHKKKIFIHHGRQTDIPSKNSFLKLKVLRSNYFNYL